MDSVSSPTLWHVGKIGGRVFDTGYMDYPDRAWYFYFSSNGTNVLYYNRGYGQSVRAVRSGQN